MMNTEEFEREILKNWERINPRAGALSMREFDPRIDPSLQPELSEKLTAGELRMLSCLTHPARRSEWLAARRAERRVITLLRGLSEDFDLSDVRTSVSHTVADDRGVVVCAAILAHQAGEGLGVDLESSDRPLDERVRGRLLQTGETRFVAELALLDFWVIKEACFKAFAGNEGTVLTQYEVTEWEGGVGSATGPQGSRFRFFVMDSQGWKFALAQALPHA